MKKENNTFNMGGGFTMLEMIVALGVFATVAVLSISSLLSLTGAKKKALTLQSVQDNLRFSIEAIARDLRQGDFFYCSENLEDFPDAPAYGELPPTQDCAGGQIITFLNRENNVTTYRIGTTDSSSSCGEGHLCIEKAVRNTGTLTDKYSAVPNFSAITSQDIEINQFDLYVTGSAKGDSSTPDLIEPRITIVVDGIVKIGKEESEFHLQTSVSSHRNLSRD
ncbi:MAG: type II secretion system protein [Patescibacteria group bacterium]